MNQYGGVGDARPGPYPPNPVRAVPPVIVRGRLFLEAGQQAAGVRLRFVQHTFGGQLIDLKNDVTTAPDGSYVVSWGPVGPPANVEVRIVGADGRDLPLTSVIADLAGHGELNLVVPQRIQFASAEHARLRADLGRHVPAGKLGLASAGDLNLLQQATGWDTESLAHAVAAERLAPRVGVDPQVLYGLMRAGLPGTEAALAWVSDAALQAALTDAVKAGIVSLDAGQLAAAGSALADFGRQARARAIAPSSLSPLADMLDAAGLTPDEQGRFDRIFAGHQGSAAELWTLAEREKLPVDALRTTSRLGFLTGNNATLVHGLRAEIGSAELGPALVGAGLYEAEAWLSRLRDAAGSGDPAALVPPAYLDAGTDARLAAYAEDMARKIRLSYPTEVAAHQVRSGQLRLGPGHDPADAMVNSDVSAFLTAAPALGYELGRTPLTAFVDEHAGQLFGGMPPARVETTVKLLRTLQRVHQISPTVRARKVLLDNGITCAQDVVAIAREHFIASYADRLGKAVAELVHRQAWLVTTTTYTFYGAISQPSAVPGLPVTAPPAAELARSRAELTRRFPSMAELFGDLDFCECEHCRSVLSPAAYLVDLLKFLDPDEPTWRAALNWLSTHHDPSRPGTPRRPFDVLTGRRPDLARLPLTCENTNTLLPYIDIVNEILEYYFAHRTLPSTSDTAWDTGDADADDLAAEPTQLLPEVYASLREAVFPIGAPFDLWWETVRRYAEHYETPLWLLRQTFLVTDELVATPFGRAEVRNERLGIPAVEHAVLTAADPESGLHLLYGLADPDDVYLLSSAKRLAGQLAISYAELVSLLRTDFINPRRHLVLYDPDAGCSFERTVLRHADGSEVDLVELVLLNYFVRLWRRLGWTIDELDRALTVFLPGTPDPRTGPAIGPALASAIIGLSYLDELAQRLGVGRTDVLRLWSAPDGPDDAMTFLAAAMALSADELTALREMSGIDPFMAVHAGPLGANAEDSGYQAVRFVQTADALTAAGLSVSDVDYLVRHRFDPLGDHRAAVDPPIALARALATDIRTVNATYPIPADPLAITDEALSQQLALALPAAVAEQLSAMWTGSVLYQATQAAPESDALDPAAFAAEPAIAVYYDPVTNSQTLRYRGVPTEGELSRLFTAHPDPLFGSLLDQVSQQAQEFFERWLLRSSIGDTPVGFLDQGDFDVVFAPVPSGLSDMERQDRIARRRARLATAFLPHLRDKLIRELVVRTVSADGGADPGLTEALLTDPALLDDGGEPLLDAFVGIAETEPPAEVLGDPGRAAGWFEVPASGPYRFFVACEQAGAQVRLRLDHLPDPLISGTATRDGAELSAHTELKAGIAYRFTLAGDTLGGGRLRLSVQGEQVAKAPLGALTRYGDGALTRLHRAHQRLAKVLLLATRLNLTEPELAELIAGGIDLGTLPTASDLDPARARVRFGRLTRLLDYVRLRTDLAAEPGELTALFRQARGGAATLTEVCTRFGRLTRRDPAMVERTATLLGLDVAAFTDDRTIARLWRVLALAARFGVDPEALHRWATHVPDQRLAADIRDTLRARYQPAAWRGVARSVSDPLRALRRDALVAHIRHLDGFESVERLYEHFLVDPATEPVVRTSRLRLAISSVQLFVQRCLLNLEEKVHPALIDAERWEWLKRYRVWEANRKIFLYPENLLEPEFRDDKTHLFAELESSLLQTDLSDDDADRALRSYLAGLDKIARLDIRAIYVQEEPDPAGNVLHVLARTYSAPHEHFYRSYAHGNWSPWVPVSTQVDGDHAAITYWRGRVYLFWVTFVERPQLGRVIEGPQPPPVRHVSVQLHWAQYQHGVWSPPATSGFLPDDTPLTEPFDSAAMFVFASPRPDGSMGVNLTGDIDIAIRLSTPNAPASQVDPEPVSGPPLLPPPFPVGGGRWLGGQAGLSVHYQLGAQVTLGRRTELCETTETILGTGRFPILVRHPQRLSGAASAELGPLLSPFFYLDDAVGHTYYVEPSLTVVRVSEADDAVVASPPRKPLVIRPALSPRFPTTASTPTIAPISKFARFRLLPPSTRDSLTRKVVRP